MNTDPRTLQRTRFMAFTRFAQTVAVVGIADGAAWLVVGGQGSRIAMRISGALTDDCAELSTGTGFPCGDITLSGTFPLLSQGVFLGIGMGGLLYLVARPWLFRTGRWHGLVFGVLLLLVFGNVEIRPAGSFLIFSAPLINVAFFAMLPLLFGMAFPPLMHWTDRALVSVPPQGYPGIRRWASYVLIAGGPSAALFVTGVLGLALFATVVGATQIYMREALLIGSFLYLLVLGSLVRTRIFQRVFGTLTAAMLVGAVVLAAPIVGGGVLTTRAIARILGY